MDDVRSPAPTAEPRDDERLTLTRRDFLKGVGSGALVTTIPLAGAAEAAQAAAPAARAQTTVRLAVNGAPVSVAVQAHWTLLDVLRRDMALTGPKKFCDRGSCGACTVIMNGRAVYSCSRLAIEADGSRIETVEGLLAGEKLHPLQQAFLEHDGLQCGYCTPGQIMSAKALLDRNPKPTADEVREGLSGNLCRCSAYPKILASVLAAAGSA